jgi:hypothetical protein
MPDMITNALVPAARTTDDHRRLRDFEAWPRYTDAVREVTVAALDQCTAEARWSANVRNGVLRRAGHHTFAAAHVRATGARGVDLFRLRRAQPYRDDRPACLRRPGGERRADPARSVRRGGRRPRRYRPGRGEPPRSRPLRWGRADMPPAIGPGRRARRSRSCRRPAGAGWHRPRTRQAQPTCHRRPRPCSNGHAT